MLKINGYDRLEKTNLIKSEIRLKNLINYNIRIIATVAQLVEQIIRNDWVGGSTPLGGSQ